MDHHPGQLQRALCLLTNGAVSSGFTLTNGWAADLPFHDGVDGGGRASLQAHSSPTAHRRATWRMRWRRRLWRTLNNCTLTSNSAGYGGGAYVATLNMHADGNSAGSWGGGGG